MTSKANTPPTSSWILLGLAGFLVLISMVGCLLNNGFGIDMANEFNAQRGVTPRGKQLQTVYAVSSGVMVSAFVFPAFFFSLAPLKPSKRLIISIGWMLITAGCVWVGNSTSTDIERAEIQKPEFAFLLPAMFLGISAGPFLVSRVFHWNIKFRNSDYSRIGQGFSFHYKVFAAAVAVVTIVPPFFFGFSWVISAIVIFLFAAILGAVLAFVFKLILRSRRPIVWTILCPLLATVLCFAWFEITDGYPRVSQTHAQTTLTLFSMVSVAFVLVRFAGIQISSANSGNENQVSLSLKK